MPCFCFGDVDVVPGERDVRSAAEPTSAWNRCDSTPWHSFEDHPKVRWSFRMTTLGRAPEPLLRLGQISGMKENHAEVVGCTEMALLRGETVALGGFGNFS
jgi:hypothetical protein